MNMPSLSNSIIEKQAEDQFAESVVAASTNLSASIRGYLQASLTDNSRRAYHSDL